MNIVPRKGIRESYQTQLSFHRSLQFYKEIKNSRHNFISGTYTKCKTGAPSRYIEWSYRVFLRLRRWPPGRDRHCVWHSPRVPVKKRKRDDTKRVTWRAIDNSVRYYNRPPDRIGMVSHPPSTPQGLKSTPSVNRRWKYNFRSGLSRLELHCIRFVRKVKPIYI